ncbi:cyclophilin-like fold protein [Agrilactobacillus yilanensis]|uniref:Cyclophilin-like fold protein n=1 Tax=Agrilactobacillus yilanensis TaxID=2485997 RepID=A0ABW4J5N8_9LACO|nr:cyclophilin-like fold protein [Agrilactobacillus yilanensis]
MVKIKMNVNHNTLIAEFEHNATAQALLGLMPAQLPMLNLYARELTYRFKQALPANETQSSGYRVGDIAYWPPRHSFVIFYKQTGEVIGGLQPIGHIISGDLTQFGSLGDVTISLEQM